VVIVPAPPGAAAGPPPPEPALTSYLDFEKPIKLIEEQIAALSSDAEQTGAQAMSAQLTKLKQNAERLLAEMYAKLEPWQKQQVARHVERPHFRDYTAALVTDFMELAGDRKYAEDAAVVGGMGRFMGRPCIVMGHEKGRTTQERIKHNFGMSRPEGYRKAIRLMDMAERFGLPVVTLVDTPGAYPGLGAEERGGAEAIARSTERCLTLGVPMVTVIVGEGGSGGAIAIAAANNVFMLEHAVYSVISPEGAASILFRDAGRAKDAAAAMKITAQDCLEFKVIDGIIKEPVGGAHRAPEKAVAAVGAAVAKALDALSGMDAEALRAQRRARFLAIGRTEETRATAR
jgi:acetyl-CoA carboxylase carboxyl transferase subunit alpha